MDDMALDTARAAPMVGEGAATSKRRIDFTTRLLVARLRDAEPDRSIASIASVAGISESSARRLLSAHATEVKTLAKQMMNTAVAERLEDWERACVVAAEKGYHQPSKDWLEASGAIEGKANVQANVNVTPTVVLNMPFALGALQAPATTIEATAQPVLPPASES
jgi:hypothetical protein